MYRPDFPIGTRCAYYRPASKHTRTHGPWAVIIVGYQDEKLKVVLIEHIPEFGAMAPSWSVESTRLIPDPAIACTHPPAPQWHAHYIEQMRVEEEDAEEEEYGWPKKSPRLKRGQNVEHFAQGG